MSHLDRVCNAVALKVLRGTILWPSNIGGHVGATRYVARRSLYPRFYESFASAGETSMPVDATLLRSDAFYELLARLRLHAAQHDSEHW